MSEKLWDVIAAGDLFIDLVLSGFEKLPAMGEEGFAEACGRETGGGSANTACGMARLGSRAAILGIVGQDEAGWFRERFAARGVDTSMLCADSHHTSAITVAVSTPAERIFYTYYGPNSQLPGLLAQPDVRERLALARHVHFAMPVAPPLLVELGAWLRRNGTTTSIDVGWQEKWLDDPASRDSLRHVDWFLPNEREAERMTGESQAGRVLSCFHDYGVRGVVIKLGPQGSAALFEGQCRVIPSIAVSPIDTTGAGDCFNAGFLWAILNGMPLESCLRTGNICGALSTEASGGIAAFPTSDRVLSLKSHFGPQVNAEERR